MDYWSTAQDLLSSIKDAQGRNVEKAAEIMASSIAGGGLVHVYGSGHSVIPVMDIFPRYGSYPGFHPLLDPRLMWFDVLGSGGVRELLWLERQEGYVKNFLQNQDLRSGDVMLVYSHGGLNAAPIEAAVEAKRRGLAVVAVTSMENQRTREAKHSSGKKLSDLADVTIDNCVPPEDALVSVSEDWPRVAAGSTLTGVAIAMGLVAEVAGKLEAKGINPPVFVSPDDGRFPADHNDTVFAEYARSLCRGGG